MMRIGCLAIVIFGVIVGIIAYHMAGDAPPVVSPTPQTTVKAAQSPAPPAPDPIEEKYGMSADAMKHAVYKQCCEIVNRKLGLRDYQAYPIDGSSDHCKFFEFEKRDGTTLIGTWAGVNVSSRVTVKQKDGTSATHTFAATYHYDPADKKFYCKTFSIDGEPVTLEDK